MKFNSIVAVYVDSKSILSTLKQLLKIFLIQIAYTVLDMPEGEQQSQALHQ